MTGSVATLTLPPTHLTCVSCSQNLAACTCTHETFLPAPLLLVNVRGTLITERRATPRN